MAALLTVCLTVVKISLRRAAAATLDLAPAIAGRAVHDGENRTRQGQTAPAFASRAREKGVMAEALGEVAANFCPERMISQYTPPRCLCRRPQS